MALLLQAEGVDVNKGDVSNMLPTLLITSSPYPTSTSNSYHYWCGVSCPLSLQGLYGLGSPLQTASRKGHIKIVNMLLQVDGIDVNKEVSSMIFITDISPSHPITTNLYHYLCAISLLFPRTETTLVGLL